MTTPFLGFWGDLPRPVVGLAPMDGVTDVACRQIHAQFGRPDVLFTEFTHVLGLFYAPERLLRDFEYTETQRPIVAQIYGDNPDDYYRAAHAICELGFDGIDINMGCPSKKVTQRNCGAKLITVPKLALEIIQATRQGILDWTGGQTLEGLGLKARFIQAIEAMNRARTGLTHPVKVRRQIPYSVKTRIGYDSIVIESWIETLLAERPAVISIHGRTLKQMYRGAADWGAIGRAARVAQGTGTLILGNGDVTSLTEASERILATNVDGVLLGRATIGNPWAFHGLPEFRAAVQQGRTYVSSLKNPTPEERAAVALAHIRFLLERRDTRAFEGFKKHLAGYLKNFPNAALWRTQAVRTKNLAELEAVLALRPTDEDAHGTQGSRHATDHLHIPEVPG